jgi:UDP-N-acetylglucosamine 2-epimerase
MSTMMVGVVPWFSVFGHSWRKLEWHPRASSVRVQDRLRSSKSNLKMAVSMRDNQEKTEMPDDYHDTNVSVKVVKLIQSYAKIVNEMVWGK